MRTIYTMLRVPNLLIIALTFLLIRYFVFIPVYGAYSFTLGMGSLQYLLMITATILIAAAGYISNDYFDVTADKINKPGKLYIESKITASTALSTAILFGFSASVLGIWLAVLMQNLLPAFLLLIALAVVWWYAISLKKSLLWGNIAVAGMSAGTIAMAWIVENQCSRVPGEAFRIITAIITAISIFAFLLSMMREIVKDMEDMEGDRLINCRSLPIVKGIPFTRTTLQVFTVITLLLLIFSQIYLAQFSRLIAVIWLLICVEIPLLYFLKLLTSASLKADYHKLSTLLKWIMIGGIGSIIAGQF